MKAKHPTEKLMSAAEVCDLLGLASTASLTRLARREGLPLIRLGSRRIVISRDDLTDFIESRKEVVCRG